MEYYSYDNVPELKTIKLDCYEDREKLINMVNILNDPYNKEIFGLDKFTEAYNKHLCPGSIVKVKDMPYHDKWGIIVSVKVNEYPKILPSHKLSKNKTQTARVYEIAIPCGFNDEAYTTETYKPSRAYRIIPMDVPFSAETIEDYKKKIEKRSRKSGKMK